MPTYEYACTRCGQHVEVFQRLSEPPLETCGVCGGALRKVFHPAGIVFKGSGFYATDSRTKPKPEGSEGAKDASKDDGKDRGKKETADSSSSSTSPSSPTSSSSSSSESSGGSGSGTTSSTSGENTS